LNFQNNTLFFAYFTLLQRLSSQSVSIALFSSGLCEAPPSWKGSVLWLASWMCCDWSTASSVFRKCPFP